VWLAQEIGSEGMGLYQLTFSVYVLATTFALSGTSTAVTRLVAEELALGSKKGVLKILRKAILVTLFIAVLSVIVLYFGAEFIAEKLLCDVRTLPALKILPLSLPFLAVTSCLRGYFIARRKAAPNAISQIFEQAVRIVIILLLLNHFKSDGLESSCYAIILGDAAAEILSCAILYILYLFDKNNLKTLKGRPRPPYPILKQILHISLPITSGRYLNSLLRTAENILVPKNLAKFPHSNDNALSLFGAIKGMALPLLFFPSAILNAVSTLLIPEISEAIAQKNTLIIKNTYEKVFKLTVLVGLLFGSVFFVAGNEIGLVIYKDASVGFLLKALSPIVPLMYLDSISDGILKGLDQQVFTFRTAIADSVIRIILILLLLPKTGLMGFIYIMYFSNFLTCILNVGRLLKISKAKINFIKMVVTPLILSLTICLSLRFLLLSAIKNNILLYTVLFCGLSCIFYLILIFRLNIVKKSDFLG
jgi:stage V sporulation protein B